MYTKNYNNEDSLSCSERNGFATIVRKCFNYKEECVLNGPEANTVFVTIFNADGTEINATYPPEPI
jgi:hypothetical protein